MNERKNALHPFTAQQKKLMEDHYGLLQWFLSFGWVEQKDSDGSSEKVPFSLLEKEDVYDAALDGYMYAVQQYDEHPERYDASFSAVVISAMRRELLRLVQKKARRFSRLAPEAYEAALRILSDAPVSGEQRNKGKKPLVIRQGNVLRLPLLGNTDTGKEQLQPAA